MEVLVYGLICGIMGLAGAFNPLSAFLDSAKGGIVEEFVEAVIDKAFKSGAMFFNRHKKNCRTMIQKAVDHLKNLDKDKLKELQAFFKSHKASVKKGKEIKIEVDVATLSSDNTKLVKETMKNFGKQLIALYKVEEKTQTAMIHFVTAEEAVRSIFGLKKKENYPDSLKKLVEIIITHVYELLYVGMASDDRDLAKVIQYMLEENNEELIRRLGEEGALKNDSLKGIIDDLKDTVAMILQQHESGALASVVTIEKARKDPFCFVKLVCPDCHATGEYIVRKGDRTYCKKCGNEHHITENVEELKDLLKDTQEAMLKKLGAEGEETRRLFADEIAKISQKIVTVEYFDKKFKDMEAAAEKKDADMRAILEETKDFADDVGKGIEQRINIEGEKMEAYLNAVLKQNDEQCTQVVKLKDFVKDAVKGEEARGETLRVSVEDIRAILDQSSERMEKIASELQSGIRYLCEQSDEIKGALCSLDAKSDKTYEGVEKIYNYAKKTYEDVVEMREGIEEIKYSGEKLGLQISEMKDGMTKMQKLLESGNKKVSGEDAKKLDKFFTEMRKFIDIAGATAKGEKIRRRECPYCERGEAETTFKKAGGSEYYRCPHCEYPIHKDHIELEKGKLLAEESWAVEEAYFRMGDDKRVLLFPRNVESVNSRGRDEKLHLKIELGVNSPLTDLSERGFNLFIELRRRSLSIQSIAFVSTTSIILDMKVVGKILTHDHLSSIKRVVIGGNVELPGEPQMPGWSYADKVFERGEK